MKRQYDWSHLEQYRNKKHPALIYVLRGLFPPTRENVLLAFKPGLFFAELSKVSGFKERTLQRSYYKARREGLITPDAIPRLTKEGLERIRPYTAQKLGKDARLLLIYDIPMHMEAERRALNRLLHSLELTLVQQSVWSTDKDHREVIRRAIQELGLEDCVAVYESLRLKI